MHWMFRCHEVSRRVSLSMESALPLTQRAAIRIHLAMCRYCARFRRQLLALRKLGRHSGAPATPAALSPEAKERIKRALRSVS